jgi:dTDP-glucose 4,6-dehydratase
MPTLLVTGGAGFIGSNYVLRSLSQHADLRIVNLDVLTYAGNLDTLRPLSDDSRHIFIRGDIGDAALVADLFEKYQPDAVVNFAAESHVDRSIDGPAAFIETNVVGTLNLLQCALNWWRNQDERARELFRFL